MMMRGLLAGPRKRARPSKKPLDGRPTTDLCRPRLAFKKGS